MAKFKTRHDSKAAPAKAGAQLDPETRKKLLEQSDKLATILDSAVTIPGTSIKLGLDSVVGLIPGIGDAAGFGLSLLVVGQAYRAGVSKPVLMKMLGNVAVDGVVGLVPVLGDAFDLLFRANDRNMQLLREELAEPEPPEPEKPPLWERTGVLVALGGVALLLAYWAGSGFQL